MSIGAYYKSADWKTEKHVPVIECPDVFAVDGFTDITVTVGKEIPHPNAVEHHIRWINLFFISDKGVASDLGRCEFNSHGEGSAFTASKAVFSVKLTGPGTLVATSYCNIHGLWESSKVIS
jgi:superoxide reductase